MKELTAQTFLVQQLNTTVFPVFPVLDLYQSVKGNSVENDVIGTEYIEDNTHEDPHFMSIDMLINLLKKIPLENRERVVVLNLSGCYLFDKDWISVEHVVNLLPRCEVVLLRGCKFRAITSQQIRTLLSKLKFLDVNYCRLSSPNREDIFSDLSTEELCKYVIVQSKEDVTIDSGWRLYVLAEQEEPLISAYKSYFDTYFYVFDALDKPLMR
jgi:hypothetical protein